MRSAVVRRPHFPDAPELTPVRTDDSCLSPHPSDSVEAAPSPAMGPHDPYPSPASSPDMSTPKPHSNDVLCGRGGTINAHPGNEQYRRLVDRKKRVYLTARFKRVSLDGIAQQ